MKILERTIEDALVEYLKNSDEFRYIGRQIRLPMGIIDVLAFHVKYRVPYLFEVKRGDITEENIVQMLGYLRQIETIMRFAAKETKVDEDLLDCKVIGVMVGSGIKGEMSNRLFEIMDFDFWKYTPNDGIKFTEERQKLRWAENVEYSFSQIPFIEDMVAHAILNMVERKTEHAHKELCATKAHYNDKFLIDNNKSEIGVSIIKKAQKMNSILNSDVIWKSA